MYKYKLLNGKIVTVEDKYIEAFRSSKDFEGAVLLEGPVKTEAVATETAPVTAENQAVDTGLASENGSSDLPESDLENTRFEIDPVVIKATKSDNFKNTEANAKKLNDRITEITPATSKGQIGFEYLGFEDKGGYITPKLEEKDRPYEYVKINADGERQVYEHGIPGSFDGYSKQYKNTFEEDLKNKLGESRYNQAMNAVNAAASKGVNLTKDNLGDFVDLSLIPEYVQENVVNSLQATASDGFVQTLEPQERLDITSMLGTDAFKEAVRKENEARLKDEEDYFNQYGRNLVSQQTVMDLKTRKKRTFTPVKNAQLVSSVDSNIAKFKKIAEKSFTNEQKEIKIFGDQLKSDLKDYEIKSKKYNELLNGISSSYRAAKKLLESEYSEENVNAVNAIVSEYNNVINSDDFKGVDTSFKSITNERLRLTNKIKKVTEDAGKLKLLGIQTNSLSKDYSDANRLALQLEDFFIASPLVAAADIVSYMGPAVVSNSSMIGLGGEVKAMMDSGGRAAMSYKKAVSEKIEKLPQTAKPGDKDFEIGNYLVSTMADQSGSFLVTAGTMVATGGGASLLAAARAATVSKSIFFATEYGGSIYDAKTSRSQAVASIASLKKQLSTTVDEGERIYIEDQIQSLEGAATASDYAQTFNAFNAGTIASLAETYGTLGTVKYTRSFAKSIGPDSFKKIFNPAMSRYSSIAVKSVIAGGTSVVGNNMEETLTLLGQNYSKMQVLGDDITITDGLDTEFFRTNTIVGLAASGPSLSQNITTAIQAEFSSSSDTKKRKKANRELLAIQARLNKLKSEQTDNTPITPEINRLEKEKNEKIKEISLMHSDVLLDASQMSVDDLDNLVDDNRQLRAILKEAQELGSELDPSDTFNKARIEKLKERYLEVLSSRDRLLNKPAEAIKEKFKKSVNPAEAYYNAGLFNRGVSVVKNIKGINTTEFYGENGRKKLEDFLDKKKVNNKQEYLDGYDAGANAANIPGTKEVLIFNDNVDNALMTVSGTRAKIAAVSPFHEVGHIQSVEAGIVKDGEIVGDADAMVEGIFADIERRKDNGEISEKDYKVFKDRVEQYNTYNNYVEINQKPVVNVDELIQLVGDLTNAGVLKKSSFGKIHEIKTFLNKFYSSKNGDATKFFNLDKTSDIYDFIASWTDKVKQGRLKVSTTEEEELGKGVFSKANKELGNEIKALVPEGTSKSRYDNQVIGNVYEKLVFGTTLDGLINGQLNKYGVVGDNVYGKPKDMFLEDVKAQLYEKSLMRFNPETNDDLGGFVVNELIKYRIGDVVNRYKKEAGVEGKSLDVAAGEVGSVQEVADESMSIEDQIDLDATQARSETRLTKATKIMSKEQYDKAAKMVEEKLKDIDPKKLSYKKIGGLATDVLSEITNVPAGKILDSTKNLSKEETSRGAMFIEKNIDYIRKTLPKGAVQEAATEKLMGTATGVANSILKRLYDKNPRIKKGAGLSPWSIKPDLTNQDILDAIGRPKREDGKKFQINPRSPEGQVIKGILNLVDRNIANELARTVESDLTLEQKQDVAAGKSNTMFSKSFNLGLEAGSNTDNIASVLFSKSARKKYEQVLRAKRPELKDIPEQVDNLIKWADSLDIKDDKKAKYKKLGLFYMANGYAIFPEDGYKITESIRLATINKIDPYAFKNPNELIEKYEKVTKIARIDPDSVSEFSNKKEIAGYTIYDVQDSKKGQEAVRRVVDSNWGEKSNPWCLVARTNDTYLGHEEAYSEKEVKDIIDTNEALGNTVERAGHYMIDGKKIYELVVYAPKNGGELARSFGLWKGYNESGNGFKIAFKNGKLNSFRDGNDMSWWNRMDKPQKGPDIKSKPDANGLVADGYFDLKSRENIIEGYNKEYKKGDLTIEEKYTKDKELTDRDTFEKTKNSNKSLVESYSMEKLSGDDYIKTKTKYKSAVDRTTTTTRKLGSIYEKEVERRYYDENDNFIRNTKYENIKNKVVTEEINVTLAEAKEFLAKGGSIDAIETLTVYKAETINGKKNVLIDERKNFISSNVLFSKGSSFAIEKLLIKEFINVKHRGKVSSRTKNRYAKNIKELLEYGGVNGIDNFEKAVEAGNYTENELELINFVFEGRDWLFGLFQNEKEQNQGIKLEKLIKIAIKKIGLKDVDLNLSEGGFSSGVDIVLSTKQGKLNIELKLNEKARVGSFSIKRAGDTFSYTKGAEGLEIKIPELHEAMQEALKGEEYQKALRKYTEEGMKIGKKLLDSGKVDIETYVDEDTGQLVGPKEVFELLKKNKYQKALTISIDKVKIKNKNGKEVYVPLDQKVIELLYNNKDVHDINFGGTGMYALGESISGMPKLEADVVVNIVTSRSGSSSGVYRSIQRATPFIKIIRSTTNIDLADLSKVEPNIESLVESIKTNNFSKSINLDKEFNDIIENKTGIESYKNYKKVKAQVTGASKGKFNFFIAPSAEDFVGLLYKTLGKGKIGDAQMAWYKENLLDPYARAMEKVSRDRNFMARNFLAIKKELKIVPKNLKKKIPGEPFTQEQAIRVYIWNKKGSTIPGISENDDIYLTNFVENNEKLKMFADQVISLSGIEDYAKPGESWVTGTITTDILEALNTTKRKKYLELWQQNVDVIFSEKNLNKLEAAYGADYRKAVENILGRMKTGRNRAFGGDSLNGRFVDWMTGATGAIMFFNTRSAILQTLSSVNFINFGDNNIFAATKAFANQKQYWSDFKMLFNSEFLVERRDGLKINVNESDIADIAKEKGVRGLINKLLKLGFTPTQLADSFAIATGGATFYRNRLKALIKDGMDPAAAEKQAMRDFRETAEESQQSSRPDKISAQQAGPLGRTILAFANTPAQYARIIKKAASDIKNGRGDLKTNISKIMYYAVVQNLIFNTLQQAFFATLFDEEEELIDDKTISVANGMADSLLRGIGISGAIISVVKNTALRWVKEEKKKNPKYDNAVLELMKISPPVSSKMNKLRAVARSYSWDKDEMKEGGLSIDNPAGLAIGNVVSATTNIPLDRVIKKMQNLKAASDSEIETYKRIFLLAGWSKWELGIKEPSKINNKTLLKGIKTRPIKQRSIKTRKITTKN